MDYRAMVVGEFMLIGFLYLLRKGRLGLLIDAMDGTIALKHG